jgi:hypothetical protein
LGLAQSFTPALPSIDFVRLKFSDENPTNGLGAVLSVVLRANAIDGATLGSTQPVTLPDGFAGTVNFYFSPSIPLAPGTLYYFQPLLESGDQWHLDAAEYNYAGGTGIFGGTPQVNSDLWFRQGIIVPEPSGLSVLLISAVLFAGRRFRCR